MVPYSSSGSQHDRSKVSRKQVKMMRLLDTRTYLLLVVFQLLHQHCMAVAGDILVAPEAQYIPINMGSAEFYCQVMGHNNRWLLDNVVHDPNNSTLQNGLQFVEFVITNPIHGFDNTYNMYVWIPSSPEWNNTQVVCISARDQPSFSPAVPLIIMGGPAAPEPVLRMISSSELILEWNKPFTWDQYPLEHYTIVSNSSHYYHREQEIGNVSISRESVQIEKMEGLSECEVIEFSLKANNVLDNSPAGNVTGGFPIALDISVASIDATVTYSTDLMPIVTLDIQLPRVCWFQEIEYHIVLMRFENGRYIEANRTKPQRIEYLKTQSVQEMFPDTQKDFVYKALAIFKTFAENDESLTESVKVETIIYTGMIISTTTGPTPSPTTSASEPIVVDPNLELGLNSAPISEEVITAIAIVGTVIVLIMVMFAVIAFLACLSIRRRTRITSIRTSIQNRPLPMVTNPIYDGSPVYETVDNHLNSLKRPDTPTTPTSIAPLLIESPYPIITSESSYTTEISRSFPEPDNYTIMLSAGQVKDRPTSEEIRYFPDPGSMIAATSSEW